MKSAQHHQLAHQVIVILVVALLLKDSLEVKEFRSPDV
ncbi:hypothetical protein STAFG_7525 [Streptomyces afghaniensis 772]|uniref:Uncharacterized protein n=1 Tax=Streptomyces afghaniensis 772 TaxID=1283301 RepID=S4MPS5_9ACTN|nr:hypothetical protein STAFG_7525 [Streptomyces afghaniensis 772]